jgi:CDP-diglyceride synthetase
LELLKRVLTAVVLIPIVLVLVLRAPMPVLAFVSGTVALLAIHELLKLTENFNIRPLYLAVYFFF